MVETTSDNTHPGSATVAIVMGSQSDWSTMCFASEVLTDLGVSHSVGVVSAHRTPKPSAEFAESAETCTPVVAVLYTPVSGALESRSLRIDGDTGPVLVALSCFDVDGPRR